MWQVNVFKRKRYELDRELGRLCKQPQEQSMNSVSVPLQTVLLLAASNVFMTIAWYGHLKNLADKPWYLAAIISWGIALFEYLLQVPANRIGYAGGFTLAQLKITQEVITLAVFVPFAM